MSLISWLGLGREPPTDERRETVREIARRLEALGPERGRFVALFAFLLARVANVDESVSPEETEVMEGVVAAWGGLPPAEAALAVAIAKAQSRMPGAEGRQAVREFRGVSNHDQKVALLHCLFAVAAADEAVSGPEESVIEEIANDLLLTPPEFLGVRARYRERRAAAGEGPPDR
ncbi:MAG TPA: TerB family tellurite resistance protein [Anaeromyxobacteraceae bacterium]